MYFKNKIEKVFRCCVVIIIIVHLFLLENKAADVAYSRSVPRALSLLSCCFLRQETLLHSLHPGV